MIYERGNHQSSLPKYSYMITPQPTGMGGGWCLHLLIDGEETKSSAFSLPEENYLNVIKWWSRLTKDDHVYWMRWADSMLPSEVYRAYFTAETYEKALKEAEAWITSNQKNFDVI